MQEKRNLARTLFLNSGMTRKEIAAQVKTTEKTLRKWIDEDGWEKLKDLKSITRAEALEESYEQLKDINLLIKALQPGQWKERKVLFDAKAVINRDIERHSSSPLSVYIDVIDRLIDWTAANHPEDTKKITQLGYEYIEEVNRKSLT